MSESSNFILYVFKLPVIYFKAVAGISQIISQVNMSEIASDLMEIINKLNSHEFNTEKISAMNLISVIILKVNNNQRNVLCG